MIENFRRDSTSKRMPSDCRISRPREFRATAKALQTMPFSVVTRVYACKGAKNFQGMSETVDNSAHRSIRTREDKGKRLLEKTFRCERWYWFFEVYANSFDRQDCFDDSFIWWF